MEKKKYSLCLAVLRRLEQDGVLKEMLLVGSWCIIVYNEYFKGRAMLPPLRTRDLEFLIPLPASFEQKTDLEAMFKELGFVVDFKGEEGYIVFLHPDLILEFLVPARGKETNIPYTIDALGINAQALRFMDLLAQDTIRGELQGILVRLPHPANFALQKLLISSRRKDENKGDKDRRQSVAILRALSETNEYNTAHILYESLPRKWKKTISDELTVLGETSIHQMVTGK